MYSRFVDPCADALKESLEKSGVNVTLDDANDLAIKDWGNNIDVWISVTNAYPFTLNTAPPILDAITDSSSFRDLRQFSKFIQSPLYSNAFKGQKDTFSDLPIQDPLSLLIMPHRTLLGIAYAASAHLFTGDLPMTEPTNLSGRYMLGNFTTTDNLLDSKAMDFAWDGILNHGSPNIESQKSKLTDFISKRDVSSYVIAEPFTLADEILPRKARMYASLATWHVMTTSIYLDRAPDHTKERFEYIKHFVDPAASSCSQKNFLNEKDARAKLEAEGTTMVPVDLDAFMNARRSDLIGNLDKASQKFDAEKSRFQQEQKGSDSEDDSDSKLDEAEADRNRAKSFLDTFDAIQALP